MAKERAIQINLSTKFYEELEARAKQNKITAAKLAQVILQDWLDGQDGLDDLELRARRAVAAARA